MIQKVKSNEWIDETGKTVPVQYISLGNRLKERYAGKLLNDSKIINKRLLDFKNEVMKLCQEVYNKMMEEFKVNATNKGNYTWFSFDRSVKIEVSISERIEFDDMSIKACKQLLEEFLSDTLDSKTDFVKDLVTDAFSTSHGKLDSKKVMSLLKYRTKITNPKFQSALNLLESSITRPSSKTYFRIWERNDDGSYSLIDLNFSSI